MNPLPAAPIGVRVDATNPGQFFACCGLLELADRMWGGAEGWFEAATFFVHPLDATPSEVSLGALLDAIALTSLEQLEPADDYSSPIRITSPFRVRLDWWNDGRAGGKQLKVWAGSMRALRIARAMQWALRQRGPRTDRMFDYGSVVYDPDDESKKVEPYYFDARRGASALAIDVGFSPDSVKMTTVAYPAVEFLCLVGLQRFRPAPTEKRRMFEYHTWTVPLAASVAPAAVCGLLPYASRRFRFQNAFRTDQRKHKAFTPATLVKGADDARVGEI